MCWDLDAPIVFHIRNFKAVGLQSMGRKQPLGFLGVDSVISKAFDNFLAMNRLCSARVKVAHSILRALFHLP